MGKRQLLFVTHRNENITEGVSYAIELAKAMDEDIMILFVQKRTNPNLSSEFENLMAAVTFAEAGEHDTAKQIVSESPRCLEEVSNDELVTVFNECIREGVQVTVHTSPLDAISGIRILLKEQWGIDKVVLSPAITAGNISSRDMKRLVRKISRPVVTMARQSFAITSGTEKA